MIEFIVEPDIPEINATELVAKSSPPPSSLQLIPYVGVGVALPPEPVPEVAAGELPLEEALHPISLNEVNNAKTTTSKALIFFTFFHFLIAPCAQKGASEGSWFK